MDTHNICLVKEVDKKYTGYSLKTVELVGCALIRVCVVIRSNMVCLMGEIRNFLIWILFVDTDAGVDYRRSIAVCANVIPSILRKVNKISLSSLEQT